MKFLSSRLAALLLASSTLVLSSATLSAQTVAGPPNFIDYQGLVYDGSGNPLGSPTTTNYKMYFRIYDAQENGNLIWSEKQIVTVTNGQFSVRLGEGEKLDGAGNEPNEARPALDTVFDSSERFLGVSVALVSGTEPTGEIVPRLAFLTAPFSFVSERAVKADSVIDGGITSSMIDGSFSLWDVSGGNTYLNGSNVGVNTSTPKARLHVSGNDEASLADPGMFMVGPEGNLNITMDRNEILARNNGNASNLNLNPDGGNVNVGHVAQASRFHVNGTSSVSTFNVKQNGTDKNLARFVTSSGTEVARIMEGDELTLDGGDTGHLILGQDSGANLALEKNEIQARNNGAAVTLNLNTDGGNVAIGTSAKASRLSLNQAFSNVTFNVRRRTGTTDIIANFEDETGVSKFLVNNNVSVRGGASFNVTGGGAKNFLIDHPLDPKNKTLRHAAVEGPERMTIYHGSVTLDGSGKATAELPHYFEALNKEFHYQLTCVGGFANVYVSNEIDGNQFEIAGGNEGLKVCWQVTAVRDDASARAMPYITEELKAPEQRGTYLDPKAFGANTSAE